MSAQIPETAPNQRPGIATVPIHPRKPLTRRDRKSPLRHTPKQGKKLPCLMQAPQSARVITGHNVATGEVYVVVPAPH